MISSMKPPIVVVAVTAAAKSTRAIRRRVKTATSFKGRRKRFTAARKKIVKKTKPTRFSASRQERPTER
ncbi:hypothetical protein D3C86_2119200 [compost metagenome]